MVYVTSAIVADRSANVLRHDSAIIGQEFLDFFVLQIGRGFKRFVQVGDVGVVMLTVMNLHRLFIDVGLERIRGVRQRGKCEGHHQLLGLCTWNVMLCWPDIWANPL